MMVHGHVLRGEEDMVNVILGLRESRIYWSGADPSSSCTDRVRVGLEFSISEKYLTSRF